MAAACRHRRAPIRSTLLVRITHAVAWIAADTAYVLADALVTRSHGETEGKLELAETTFGERLDADSANTVLSESAVKVVRLSSNAVATLSANDARAGLEALESLSVRVRARTSIEESLVEVQRLHQSDNFSLLIAAASRSGTMSIFSLSGG